MNDNSLRTTPYKINCYFLLIYESPRGLSICDLFTNFSAETRNEIIHKHVTNNDKFPLIKKWYSICKMNFRNFI